MIVRRLIVDAFGALRDLDLDGLGPGLTVLYGPNEAGKSTLMRSLRWLLFAQDLVPPPQGAASVRARLASGPEGEWHVARRVTAKARRGVLVATTPQGDQADDGRLGRDLLHGTSWPLYRQVFAVGLKELEDATALDASEVAGALYSAGAVGAADLRAVEKALREEAEALWRPRATKSAVNKAMRRVGEAHAATAEARAAEERIGRQLSGRPALEAALAEARRAARTARSEADLWQMAHGALAHIEAIRQAERALAAIEPAPPLPEGAVARLDAIERRLEDAARARAALAPALADAPPPDRLRSLAVRVRELAGDADRHGEDEARLAEAQAGLARLETERLRALREAHAALGHDGNEADDRPAPPFPAAGMREDLRRAGQRLDGAQRAAAVAQAAGRALAPCRPEGQDDPTALAPDDAQNLLSALVQDMATLSRQEPVGRTGSRLASMGAALWLTLAVAAVAGAGWLGGRARSLAALGALGIAAGAAWLLARALRRTRSGDGGRARGRDLMAAVARASIALGGPPVPGQVDVAEMAGRIRARRDAVRACEAWDAADRAAADEAAAREEYGAVLAATGLPASLQPAAVESAWARLDAWQRAEAAAVDARAAYGRLLGQTRAYADAVAELWGDGSPPAGPGPAALARLAGAALDRAVAEAQIDAEERAARAALGGLVAACGAADGETLRHRAAQADRRAQALEERARAERALGMYASDKRLGAVADRLLAMPDPGARASAVATLVRAAEEAQEAAQVPAGDLRVLDSEVERLRAHSGLAAALQGEAAREAEVVEAAEAWAEAALALWLLDRAKARYEEERQPATLRHASTLFGRMTEQRYERIVRPFGGGDLKVLRRDGERMDASMLSQGTRAQLYLAMRLALAQEYGQRVVELPILLDDVLVAFDDVRRRAAVEALAEIGAGGRQILLFTCHRAGLEEAARAGAAIRTLAPAPPGEARGAAARSGRKGPGTRRPGTETKGPSGRGRVRR